MWNIYSIFLAFSTFPLIEFAPYLIRIDRIAFIKMNDDVTSNEEKKNIDRRNVFPSSSILLIRHERFWSSLALISVLSDTRLSSYVSIQTTVTEKFTCVGTVAIENEI